MRILVHAVLHPVFEIGNSCCFTPGSLKFQPLSVFLIYFLVKINISVSQGLQSITHGFRILNYRKVPVLIDG